MIEFLADPNLVSILLLIVLGVAGCGLVMLYLLWRKERHPEESPAASNDWQATGKIDFYSTEKPKEENSPAAFLLRVEEFRTVPSISGVEHTEIRWRKAMLSEAKSVLLAYRNAVDTKKTDSGLPRLVGG
jgi:hypothetical protein